MNELHYNTVSKLYYLDLRIRSFYEANGYNNIPFNSEKILQMIEASKNEISALFQKIWGSSMEVHLLHEFSDFEGNIYELYNSLDSTNRHNFSTINW